VSRILCEVRQKFPVRIE